MARYDEPQTLPLPLPDMYGKHLTFKTGGVDYGYYYDAKDQFEKEGTSYRNGFRVDGYPDDPTDWYYMERICENWFYYEVHDG